MSGTYIHPSICIHGDLRRKFALPALSAFTRNKKFNAQVYKFCGTIYRHSIVPCTDHLSETN